jgi:hypothetical protein
LKQKQICLAYRFHHNTSHYLWWRYIEIHLLERNRKLSSPENSKIWKAWVINPSLVINILAQLKIEIVLCTNPIPITHNN